MGNRYDEAVEAGRLALGAFSVLDGYAPSHLLATAGFDYVIFDRQHAAFTWPQLENLCYRVSATGAAVFVRTAGRDAAELDLTLDLPVDGVVLPDVASVADVEEAVALTHLPPRGRRSLGNERNLVVQGRGYAEQTDPRLVLLIETVEAVEAIDDICAVDGVGAVWVGTHDLAAAMGLDPGGAVTDPPQQLTDAVARVREAARASGVHFWTSRAAVQRDAAAEQAAGATAVMWGVDARFLAQAVREAVDAYRTATGGAP